MDDCFRHGDDVDLTARGEYSAHVLGVRAVQYIFCSASITYRISMLIGIIVSDLARMWIRQHVVSTLLTCWVCVLYSIFSAAARSHVGLVCYYG
jgi:uncharacterized membrane protein